MLPGRFRFLDRRRLHEILVLHVHPVVVLVSQRGYSECIALGRSIDHWHPLVCRQAAHCSGQHLVLRWTMRLLMLIQDPLMPLLVQHSSSRSIGQSVDPFQVSHKPRGRKILAKFAHV